eukprot:TRINITY_DN13613_c0_g1_i1.p1 TRINITY_DN13613_c0_g1~~TRINITY_DN13613_c0_g1_i1.p1  ORF type:complete len:237 (+),score=66.34 TRINITY_DN13613_c0_g1_i1:1-711(+)
MKKVILAFLISIAICFAYECKPSLGGKKYDFTPLQKTDDYTIGRAIIGKGWDVVLNMCTSVSEKACPASVSICQVWDYNCPTVGCGSASLGSISQASWALKEGEAVLKFLGGDEGRNSEIRFLCAAGTGVGQYSFTNEDPVKEYNFAWSTQYACAGASTGSSSSGSGGGLSGGWVFVIIVVVVFSVYLIAGIIIKKVKFDASGSDIIPNRDFWCGLPGLVKDGIMFIVNKTCRRGG